MAAATSLGRKRIVICQTAATSSRNDFGRHGASLAQVIGKMEPPRRPLSFSQILSPLVL